MQRSLDRLSGHVVVIGYLGLGQLLAGQLKRAGREVVVIDRDEASAAFSKPVDARLRRGIRSRLELVVGEPVPAERVTPEYLMERVKELRGDER